MEPINYKKIICNFIEPLDNKADQRFLCILYVMMKRYMEKKSGQ